MRGFFGFLKGSFPSAPKAAKCFPRARRLVLETLDARSRELIRLRFEEELSYKEIAESTGLTVGNVGYILHHALKAMALELEKTEVAK